MLYLAGPPAGTELIAHELPPVDGKEDTVLRNALSRSFAGEGVNLLRF